MEFPVNSLLAGNSASETSSLETASSSGESGANLSLAGVRLPMSRSRGFRGCAGQGDRRDRRGVGGCAHRAARCGSTVRDRGADARAERECAVVGCRARYDTAIAASCGVAGSAGTTVARSAAAGQKRARAIGYKFRAVEAFDLAPQAAVARRIGRLDAFRDDALDMHRAGFLVKSRPCPTTWSL